MEDFGGRERAWKGPGCTAMKGPDYRPELASDVWERARRGSSSCFPLPSPGIWASLGGEQTDGEAEKKEGRVGVGICPSERKLESG